VVHLKGGSVFSNLFQLDPTDPPFFETKLPEILVEWIVGSNSSHSHPTLRVISQLIHKERTTKNRDFKNYKQLGFVSPILLEFPIAYVVRVFRH